MHAEKSYVGRNGLFVRIQLDGRNCQLLNLGCPLPLICNYLREKFIKLVEELITKQANEKDDGKWRTSYAPKSIARQGGKRTKK
nr:unnamed protein product [Spirometra erinaceieuropaei]